KMLAEVTVVYFSIFFFQAEECIRYGHVNGVQTCALPISGGPCRERRLARQGPPARLSSCLIALSGPELRPGQPKRRTSDGTPIAHEAQDHERQTRATAAPPRGAAGGL